MPADLGELEWGTEGLAQRAQTEKRHISYPGQRREYQGADTLGHGTTVVQRMGQIANFASSWELRRLRVAETCFERATLTDSTADVVNHMRNTVASRAAIGH